MNRIQATLTGAIFSLGLITSAHAENGALQGMKLGFGFDQGFGVTGSINKFNGFIGNDGLAIDYIPTRGKLNQTDPAHWYVGGGAYSTWGDAIGVRIPFGLEYSFSKVKDPSFAKHWDVYAQIIPKLRITNNTKFGVDAGISLRYQF